eukprot:Skav209785  [mRNA]  locus=scaffold9:650888:653065:- [translate_table: standard]
MSCFDGCFGWLSGTKKSQAKLSEEEPQLIFPPMKEEGCKSSCCGGTKQGSKSSSGRGESGRFHYSNTGMQLPDSPIKERPVVKYSLSGMPLYDEGTTQGKRSGKWAENSGTGGKWGANSSNKWSGNSSGKFTKSGSNSWKSPSLSGKTYSNTGMPMPETQSQPLRTQYSSTGMPLK